MKNLTDAQHLRLKARAQRMADRLPALSFQQDGLLAPESRTAFARCAASVLKKNRAVGASLVLLAPSGKADVFPFGDARLSPRLPVTENTCFRAASVSKLVMAFGALALCEQGLLWLDDPLDALFGWPVRSPHFPDAPVTLRMLLTHTAGIRDEGTYGTRGMESGCTLRELLSDPQNWLEQRPGAAFHYSNLGAGAAGCAMELAAGKPFDDLMQALVFQPLAIRASYDPRRIVPVSDLADGYSVRAFFPPRLKYDAARLAARPPEAFVPGQDYLCAAGRMITDSRGLAQLLRLLASHGEMGVLSPSFLDLMRTCQDGMGGVLSCGRGLNIAFLPDVFPGFSPVGHQGVAYGMCAELFADPASGAGVGLLTSGIRLGRRTPPLMEAGLDLLALGFGALAQAGHPQTV